MLERCVSSPRVSLCLIDKRSSPSSPSAWSTSSRRHTCESLRHVRRPPNMYLDGTAVARGQNIPGRTRSTICSRASAPPPLRSSPPPRPTCAPRMSLPHQFPTAQYQIYSPRPPGLRPEHLWYVSSFLASQQTHVANPKPASEMHPRPSSLPRIRDGSTTLVL